MLRETAMVRMLLAFERFRPRLVEGTGRVSGVVPAERSRELLPLFGVCLYAVLLVKTAWLADDAFASFRAAVNLVGGHGLLSNPPERVQAFTNPLWTLLFAAGYALVRDAYAVGLVLGMICSLAAVALVAFTRRVDPLSRAVAVLALAGSLAFVEYSTSGLENPLAYLLLAALYRSVRNERPLWFVSVLAALLAVNRLDHLLLVAPLLAVRLVRGGRAGIGARSAQLALGFLPLVLWELFALVYYGFPLPNTAYSKLNATISSVDFLRQGAWYLVESTARDPLTSLLLLLSLAAPFVLRRFELLPFSLGIALYLAYVMRVGGDFMAGRFLAVPCLFAVLILFHELVPARASPFGLVAGALVVLIPIAARSSPLYDEPAPSGCGIPDSGVVDERNCYRAHTALVVNVRTTKYKKHDYWKHGVELRKRGGVHAENVVGLTALAAGPKTHLVDLFALTDPLLARIPYAPKEKGWRIGHFYRPLPKGYLESVASGKNRIGDRCIARFYDRLRRVTHGPLWSWSRVEAIYWLNVRERTVTACTER